MHPFCEDDWGGCTPRERQYDIRIQYEYVVSLGRGGGFVIFGVESAHEEDARELH